MRRKNAAAQAAYPAVLGALALALLYLACIAPAGAVGIVAAAGLLPAAAVISVGLRAGLLCWAGTSILAFLLVPDKFCALLFAALFGLYPAIKSVIEGRQLKKPLEYLLKLAFFNAAFTLVYWVMGPALLGALPEALGRALWVLYPVGNIVFLAYDYGFSRLIGFYIARFRRAGH